jgi:chemotaxis protein MotB
MAKKKKHEKEPNHERWLVSYADFITLLFAVFVTLYAMSQTDKKKVEEVMASIRESFGYSTSSLGGKPAVIDAGNISIIPTLKPQVMPPPVRKQPKDIAKGRVHAEEKDLLAIKASIEAYLLKKGAQDKVGLEIGKRGLTVSLKEAGFFNSGSDIVKKDSMELLAMIAESLSHYTNPYRVEGHTDNVPIRSGRFQSNWELSTSRATNIVQYLVEAYGYEPERMSAAGYGEFKPVADNGTAEGRAKNRRVDIVLLSGSSETMEP